MISRVHQLREGVFPRGRHTVHAPDVGRPHPARRGNPWFTLVGRPFLEKKHFQVLREAAAGGDYDAAQAVQFLDAAQQFGLDEDAILKILKTVGMVFGGQTKLFGSPLPGGYLYLSGETKEVHLLLPLMEMAARESGMPFEPVTKAGWTAFYALKDPVDSSWASKTEFSWRVF